MAFGPCLCGDLHCHSCGPAQGNERCIACGAWADDGCEDPGLCESRIPGILEAEKAALDEEARQWREWEKQAREWEHSMMGREEIDDGNPPF